jgi:hypothetical protein
MPDEPSLLANEPSFGPVIAQAATAAATLTPAETTRGRIVKIIPGELITQQILASAVSQDIFVADDNYQVVSVQAVPTVIGGSGATITVEVLTGTQAPGAGVAQLTAALALNGTAHAVVTGTLIAAPTTMVAGNRLGIVMAGTLTGLVGTITVKIKRV